jgi:hypothetical protein
VSKTINKLILPLLIVCFGLYFAPKFIAFNYLKNPITERFAQELGVELKIKGDIEVKTFPSSYISLKQVTINSDSASNIEIPKIILGTNLFSLFMGDVKLNDVKIIGAQLTYQNMQSLLAKGSNNFMPKLTLENASLVMNQSGNFWDKLSNINAIFEHKGNGSLQIAGTCSMDGLNYKLNATLNASSKPEANASQVFILSDFSEIKFLGDFITDSTTYNLNGRVDAKFFNNIKNPQFSHALLAFLKDEIVASGNVAITNKEMQFSNLSVSSKSISKIIGNISLSKDSSNEIMAKIEGDSINLDSLFDSATQEVLSTENIISQLLALFDFDLPHSLFGKINIAFKEVILNKQEIKNIDLLSNLVESKVVVSELAMELPGASNIKISGVISHNEVRPKFDGAVNLEIKDYKNFRNWINIGFDDLNILNSQQLSLSSNMVIMPRNLRLSHLKINSGNLSAFAKVAFKYIGENKLSTNAVIRINEIDGDAIGVSKLTDNFIANLYGSDFEKTGIKFYEITDDFKWVRDFPISLNLKLIIEKFKYRDMLFPNFYVESHMSPNNFSIDELSLNTEQAQVSGKISLATSDIIPKLSVDLTANKISAGFIEKIMPKQELLISRQKQFLSNTPDAAATTIVGGANFYGIHNIIGDFKIKANDYLSPTMPLKNFNLMAESQDGIIKIDYVNADAFQGKLDLSGNLVIASSIPVYSLTFSLTNAKLLNLLKYYGEYDKLNGYVSLSGSLVTKGAEMDTIFSNLSASANVLGKNISWDGFDIGEIVRLGDGKSPFNEKLDKFKHFSQNGQSIFEDLSGSVKVSGGIASLNDFKFSNTRISGAYAARVDLKNKLINSFTRINFIPYGRSATMTIDIAGSGSLNAFTPTITAANYMRFLQDNSSSEQNDFRSIPILRNR